LLAIIGVVGVVRALRSSRTGDAPESHDGHEHGESLHVGWLLLAPVIALLLVTPPALRSFGIDHGARVNVGSGRRTFDPLPSNKTVPMSLIEFDQRAADDAGASFGSAQVQLTGFVARTKDRGGFLLARYQIACCAADAAAAVVRIVGVTGEPPARDSWVTVTGTFKAAGDVPELLVSSLNEVAEPADPYE
jgi:uncharacterized repeat protein (TIGR03943 family)